MQEDKVVCVPKVMNAKAVAEYLGISKAVLAPGGFDHHGAIKKDQSQIK